eukprot:s2612_g13.t2
MRPVEYNRQCPSRGVHLHWGCAQVASDSLTSLQQLLGGVVASDSLTSLQQLLGGVDVVAFGAAVGAVASTGTWPLALHTTTSMAIAQVSLNSRVLTPLLSACDAGLVWSKALQYLHAAPIVCIRPAMETRNAAATACGRAGCWPQALAILQGLGVRPDPVAHRIAVSACTAVSAWTRALHLGAGGQAAERARRWQVALALLRATPCGDEDLSQRAWALAKSPESARPQTAAHASSIRQEAFEITESALQAMNTFQASELASLVWSLASITCAEPRLLAKSFEHLLQNHRVRGLPFRELASLAMSSDTLWHCSFVAMAAVAHKLSNGHSTEAGGNDCDLNAVVVGNKTLGDVVGEDRGLLTDHGSALESRSILRSSSYLCVSVLAAYLGGMATMWIFMQRPPSVAECKPCKPCQALQSSMLANGSDTKSSDAPASYGFVYTEEGTTILEDLLQLVRRDGTRQALMKAEKLLKQNRHFLDACHPLLHRLGRTLYFEAGKDGLVNVLGSLLSFDENARREAAALVSSGSTSSPDSAKPGAAASRQDVQLLMVCNAAYLHGAIELFLSKAGSAGHFEAATRFVASHVCQRMGSDFRPPWECYHGVGHGVVQYFRDVSTRQGLKQSLQASTVVRGQHATLWNGIWMDHFASTTVSGHDADDAQGALSVCTDANAGNGQGKGDCYMYSPTAFLLHRSRSYVEALRWCEKGCSGRSRGCLIGCTNGVGMQTFKENLDNLRLVEKVCKAAQPGLESGCMHGAYGYYSFAFGRKVPKELCQTIRDAGSCFENCSSSLQAVRLFQAVQDELISQATSCQLPAAPAVLQDLAARVLDTVWACQFSGQLGRRTVQAARTLLQDIGSRFSPSVSLVSMQHARQGDPIGPGFPHVVLELGDRCVVYKPPSFWQVDDGKDEPQDASLRLSHFTQALHPPRCWPILEDRSHSRGFLHRLDIPTSGLILTAKTHCAFYDLRLQLSLGQMKREYCVLSHGFAPFARSTIRCRVHWFGNGRQAASIVAAAGRPASSKLKVLGMGHFTDLVLSLLAIHILTGRQHQIRLQMSHVGHPTVSDKRYFSFSNCLQDLAWCPRNFLHRYRLTFLDGDGRPAEVREPLPCDLRGALGQVRPGPGRSEAAFRSWMAAEPPKAWSELASLQKRMCCPQMISGMSSRGSGISGCERGAPGFVTCQRASQYRVARL